MDRNKQFEGIIDEYQNLVFSLCYKMTSDYFAAQDLSQETFIAVYRYLDGFDGSNMKAWICRIAANKCTDYLRQNARAAVLSEEDKLDMISDDRGGPESEADEMALREELKNNCNKLPAPYSEVALQYFYYERSSEEIAGSLNRNLKTVDTQIRRAREKLRELYKSRVVTRGGSHEFI